MDTPKTAHVICCNGAKVMVVIGSEELATQHLDRLSKEDFEQNSDFHDMYKNPLETYLFWPYWHIVTIPLVVEQEDTPDLPTTQAINIIFDGPQSPNSGQFVEVETDDGESIRCGLWSELEDGLWSLRITELPTKE